MSKRKRGPGRPRIRPKPTTGEYRKPWEVMDIFCRPADKIRNSNSLPGGLKPVPLPPRKR